MSWRSRGMDLRHMSTSRSGRSDRLASDPERRQDRAGPGLSGYALANKPLERVPCLIQFGYTGIKSFEPDFSKLPRCLPVVSGIKIHEFLDFLKREPRGLRLSDEPEAAEIILPVVPDTHVLLRCRQQPSPLIEANRLDPYVSGRSEFSNRHVHWLLTPYHGTQRMVIPTVSQDKGDVKCWTRSRTRRRRPSTAW
ncbi:hypothetical protein AGR2A_pa40085 [Agrobacterium genomosp. 2 str. CFBP 5494]|uniref:Uncharacterized protein n=1 Tax=Agrobacterium genomosp. 2 str. CFBP 5494 TaxID=1183436 RepID=A0A9W5B6Z2_9HYPH|nr:hypothetical protein AGR2A_pa40085 [Agrobacterium genomosp. 2 str. CFBP 5494]